LKDFVIPFTLATQIFDARRLALVNTLNQVFSTRSTRRRYEVWFLRMGLADGSGAWWFRYLLMNPGRGGCAGNPGGMPVQVWATWFPSQGKPQSLIQEFPLDGLQLSPKGRSPFRFQVGENAIDEDSCRGSLQVGGHAVSWELRYRSTYRFTMSTKGWIGFTRTPHSDAAFSGRVSLDGKPFEGDPLGFGVQGHNCGYRHRNFWTWAHAYFPRPAAPPTTLEALVYELPFGFIFRKAVLWHQGEPYVFRDLLDIAENPQHFRWSFQCSIKNGLRLHATFDGTGETLHTLRYLRTNCSGSFPVANNSLASARLRLEAPHVPEEILETDFGAVLEKGGAQP
jgi:hypothetical protein